MYFWYDIVLSGVKCGKQCAEAIDDTVEAYLGTPSRTTWLKAWHIANRYVNFFKTIGGEVYKLY